MGGDANETKSTASAPPTLKPASPNPLKRKELPDDADELERKPLSTSSPLETESTGLQEEDKNSHILCQDCGLQVDIRDPQTGAFTVDMWEEHRRRCFPPSTISAGASHSRVGRSLPGRDTVIYTPGSTAHALSHPPTKKRRAKRTEDERIDYLRRDRYVAQFEAYRVMCASCDKWIRLRPNSTYCSIPWDAHRKSCLAKKLNNRNGHALEERNSLFSKDPDVRKFDPERLLCNRCDQWLSVPTEDHRKAIDEWLHHRDSCNKTPTSSRSVPVPPTTEIPRAPPLTETQLVLASSSSTTTAVERSTLSSSPSPKPPPTAHHRHTNDRPPPHSHRNHPVHDHKSNDNRDRDHHRDQRHNHQPHSPPNGGASPSPSFHDLNPNNFAPIQESRRRNAEQRAATLRADTLIGEVEPNRVFCSLCQKWVQLRQDSSFCAYPWLQHRGKCLARHQRRAQKAAEIVDFKTVRQTTNSNGNGNGNGGGKKEEDDELISEDDSVVVLSEESDDDGMAMNDRGDHGAANGRRKRDRPAHPANGNGNEGWMVVHHGGGGGGGGGDCHQHHPSSARMVAAPLNAPKSRASHHYPPYPSSYSLDHRSAMNAPVRRSDPWGRSMGGRSEQHYAREYHLGGPSSSSRTGPSGVYHHHLSSSSSSTRRAHLPQHQQQQQQAPRGWDADEMDAEGDVDADGESYAEDEGPLSCPGGGHRRVLQPGRRVVGLADLDSPNGRKQFVASSIEFLFASTYEVATDDMPISSLVSYLNAAMPLDKHEDFDTAEVVKYVAGLKEKGRVVLEGDIVRLVD